MNRVSYACSVICLLLWSLQAAAQSSREGRNPDVVTTIEVDTTAGIACQKLLIVGIGRTFNHHFLDKLSPLLTEFYDSMNISVKYEFIGKYAEFINRDFNAAMRKHKPDAALFIYELPDGPDTFVVKRHWELLYETLIDSPNRHTLVRPLNKTFRKSLEAVLWVPAGGRVLWRGELYLSGNPVKDGFYQKYSRLLTDAINRHQLLLPNGERSVSN